MTEFLSLMRQTVPEGFHHGGGREPHGFACQRHAVLCLLPYSVSKWYVRSTPHKILRCGARKSGTSKIRHANAAHYFFVTLIPL